MVSRTNLTPVGFEKLEVTSTPSGFSTIPSDASAAVISLEGGTVRFKTFGDPSSTDGHKLLDGTFYELDSIDEIEGFRGIKIDGTNVYVQIEYYR